MNIRSITAFVDITHPLKSETIARMGEFLHAARDTFSEAGFNVQTTRLATQSFALAVGEAGPGAVVDMAKDLEALAFVHEIDYLSIGPARLEDPPPFVAAIAEVLNATEKVFAGIEIANQSVGARLPRIRRAADAIIKAATISEDGFANLRQATLARVAPWSPFFPAAYHGGGKACFALATESADLAVTAIGGASSLDEAKSDLIQMIEAETSRLEASAIQLAGRFDITFKGIDFSLAPFPDDARSIGGALEKLGLAGFGQQGSLMAAAFLTNALDQATFARTGFCGLMLPVLEDSVLAQRAAEGTLRLSDLLTFSAVCGTGLDTIPLAGEVSEEAVTAILCDVAALALRLDKPLTARLMPIPGKAAGDPVTFDFEYFADSRVMATQGELASGLLAGDENVGLRTFREK